MTATRAAILRALASMSEQFPGWRFGPRVASVSFWAGGPRIESIWEVEDEKFLEGIEEHLAKSASEEPGLPPARRVIQERDGNNTPTVTYTRGPDVSGSLEGAGGIGGLLARSSGYSGGIWSTHHYYHADGGGNITALLDNHPSSASVAATYRYDPYGRGLSSSGSLAGANRYRFSSKELHDLCRRGHGGGHAVRGCLAANDADASASRYGTGRVLAVPPGRMRSSDGRGERRG